MIRRQFRAFLKKLKQVFLDCWWWVRGRAIKNPPVPAAVTSLVFICKGNICRSAFAHYMAEQISQMNGYKKPLHISSAGLEARTGTLPPEKAIESARRFGIELGLHRSTLLTDELASGADMLVVMEPAQASALLKQFPQKRANVFLLPLFEDEGSAAYSSMLRYTIQDPYGKEFEFFMNSFDRVSRCVHGLMGRLMNS